MKFYLKALMLLNLLLASGNSIAENKSAAVLDFAETDEFDSVKIDNLETSQETEDFMGDSLIPKSQMPSRVILSKALFGDSDKVFTQITNTQKALTARANPVAPEEVPFIETFGAQLLDTALGNYTARILNGEYLTDQENPNYNPYPEIKGSEYEQHWEDFLIANGPEDTSRIKRKIDRENAVRETIDSSSVAANLMAGIGVLPLDPINFILIGGAAYRATKAGRFFAGAGQTAAAGLLSSGLSEALKTTEESVINIAATTILAGILGGAAGLVLPARRFINNLKKGGRMNFSQLLRFKFSSKLYLGIGILLMLATMPLPYGYYTFLRIVTCGFSALLSYRSFNSEGGDKSFWSWLFLFVAIIFNPIASIHMDKGVWIFIDATLGSLFLLISYKIRILEKK